MDIPARAVLDSGVLFTVLTLNYVQRSSPPEPKRTNVLRKAIDAVIFESEERQKAYLLAVSKVRTPLITSHVVGELQGLQSSCLSLYGEDLRYFWSHSMDFMLLQNFDERLVAVLDMSRKEGMREAIQAIGPPDAGLIDLARAQGCPLLTDDERTLATWAGRAGVECLIVKRCVV